MSSFSSAYQDNNNADNNDADNDRNYSCYYYNPVVVVETLPPYNIPFKKRKSNTFQTHTNMFKLTVLINKTEKKNTRISNSKSRNIVDAVYKCFIIQKTFYFPRKFLLNRFVFRVNLLFNKRIAKQEILTFMKSFKILCSVCLD